MKAFNRTTVALCLSMVVMFMIVGTAAANDANNEVILDSYGNLIYAHPPIGSSAVNTTVCMRGLPHDGDDINDIFNNYDAPITMNATQFATFFYDIDNNVTTETLTLK